MTDSKSINDAAEVDFKDLAAEATQLWARLLETQNAGFKERLAAIGYDLAQVKNQDWRDMDFSNDDLRDLDFSGSDLRGCNFKGAKISGASFLNCQIGLNDLDHAVDDHSKPARRPKPPIEYFFCGIGGSGMMPLALILRAKGALVAGSDRSLEAGRTGAKFEYLRSQGILLYPQDGSGITNGQQILVRSTAVEDTVADVIAARRMGVRDLKRPELLAQLFNAARERIGVAGTSGKSTTTGMIAWLLHRAGYDPTVMNGAVMKNFVSPENFFASALVGHGDAFVAEVDESDGSISRYNPTIAVVNNIALDHKVMDELRTLFASFLSKADVAVLNLDNEETASIAATCKTPIRTYSLHSDAAELHCTAIRLGPESASFDVREKSTGDTATVDLAVPGEHNIANALAALSVAGACGLSLESAAWALSGFEGIRRRLDIVGKAGDVTVIDDFAHNPDKIAATMKTLHAFPGRLLIMFQPHGFGPLRLMRAEFIECFAQNMTDEDVLIMPEPIYFGGTADRSVSSEHIIAGVRARGRHAIGLAERASCGDALVAMREPGDRIIIMGARDDTLSNFAQELLVRLREQPKTEAR